MKVTQKQKVKEYILSKGNKPLKYDVIAYALNIKVPNVRRILGQGIFSNDFERVGRGFYIVKKDVKTDIKNDFVKSINFNSINKLNKKDFNKVYEILKQIK